MAKHRMRNTANKMTNSIDPYTQNNFFVIFWNIWAKWICGCHSGSLWLSRPMHGSLHRSCVTVVYPNLELICDFRRSKLPVPSRPATRSFCHYPTRSRPEVKNHYPSVSAYDTFDQFLTFVNNFDNFGTYHASRREGTLIMAFQSSNLPTF